jgi:PqqD family protein of HPr-rel-A system
LLFQDFDDGVVLFDTLRGSTHLLDASAAETLAIIEEAPGLDTSAIHDLLLQRLDLSPAALPVATVESLLQRFEAMALLSVECA